MADEPRDALRRLEQRLSSASDAAERLIAEAARTAERGKPPPAGWQAHAEDERSGGELDVLIHAFQSIRELIPPDVLEQLAARERGTEAVVRTPAAEPEMVVGLAGDVEPPGILEGRLVAVAGVVEEHDLLGRGDRLAGELGVARGGAAEGEHRGRPAHE